MEGPFEETITISVLLDIRDLFGPRIVSLQSWKIFEPGPLSNHLKEICDLHQEEIAYSGRVSHKPVILAQFLLHILYFSCLTLYSSCGVRFVRTIARIADGIFNFFQCE